MQDWIKQNAIPYFSTNIIHENAVFSFQNHKGGGEKETVVTGKAI